MRIIKDSGDYDNSNKNNRLLHSSRQVRQGGEAGESGSAVMFLLQNIQAPPGETTDREGLSGHHSHGWAVKKLVGSSRVLAERRERVPTVRPCCASSVSCYSHLPLLLLLASANVSKG